MPRQRLIRFESKSRGPLSVCFLPPLICATSIVYHRLHSSTSGKAISHPRNGVTAEHNAAGEIIKGRFAVGRKTAKEENSPTNINQRENAFCVHAPLACDSRERRRAARVFEQKLNFLFFITSADCN